MFCISLGKASPSRGGWNISSVDTGMTVGASCIKCSCRAWRNISALAGVDKMSLMALEAEKRLPHGKKIMIYRAMRVMAVPAVFGHIGMLVEKRTPFLGVALDTGLLDTVLLQVCPGKTAVRVVTVNAKDPPLVEGVMARHGEFDPG